MILSHRKGCLENSCKIEEEKNGGSSIRKDIESRIILEMI